jgi:CRISPR-associated protein Cas2
MEAMTLPKKPGQPLLVLYDVSSDRVRYRVSEACKDYGMRRFQKSAFIGRLTRTARAELEARIEKEFGRSSGVVQVIPLEIASLAQAWLRENP